MTQCYQYINLHEFDINCHNIHYCFYVMKRSQTLYDMLWLIRLWERSSVYRLTVITNTVLWQAYVTPEEHSDDLSHNTTHSAFHLSGQMLALCYTVCWGVASLMEESGEHLCKSGDFILKGFIWKARAIRINVWWIIERFFVCCVWGLHRKCKCWRI